MSVTEIPDAQHIPLALAEEILLGVMMKLMDRSDGVSSEVRYCENHVVLLFHISSGGLEGSSVINGRTTRSLEILASSVLGSPVQISVQVTNSRGHGAGL